MSLTDTLASRFGRPAGRVLDAPIRDIVHELLKEHGYASPAEVQALRDELRSLKSRVEALDGRVAEALRLADSARADAARAIEAANAKAAGTASPDPRIGALEAHVAALEAQVAELRARPVPTAAPAAVAAGAVAEPRGTCKVPECGGELRSKGFCSAHYQQWRRGTLKNFVSADGTAHVDGRVVHLPSDTVGGHVTVTNGRLQVDGRAVKEVAAR